MQHGLQHKNHEPKPARASEIGQLRDTHASQADLARGWALMEEADLPNRLPVVVPPWNRIGDKLIPHLAGWGYRALSGFGPRETVFDGPLMHLNGHIEPLRWRPDAIFAGEAKTLAQCLEHLRARRLGEAHKDAPTGLVTHHLQTPEEVWDFCAEFCAVLARSNAATWVPLQHILERA